MRTKLPLLALLCAFAISTGVSGAADSTSAKSELQGLVTKIQVKLKDGKKTEIELAEDLKEFDAALARHKNEKTDDVAQILFMKAMLYIQVFDDTATGTDLMKQLKREFPETTQGKGADKMIESMAKGEEGKKIQRSLAVGAKFPDFAEKDTAGKPLSIANYKGKIVLVDFWATWCGPCVAELPNVLKTYEKHHGKGFEIIGISLDQDAAKLTAFTKEKKMTWQQFFDGKGWGNKLAVKYGVKSIPATYLLDAQGNIAAKDLRGEALEAQVAKMLGN